MHFYLLFSNFLKTVLNEHLTPMGFCRRKNDSLLDPQSQGIQFRSLLSLPVLIFLLSCPHLVTPICSPRFYHYCARVNDGGKKSEAESS